MLLFINNQNYFIKSYQLLSDYATQKLKSKHFTKISTHYKFENLIWKAHFIFPLSFFYFLSPFFSLSPYDLSSSLKSFSHLLLKAIADTIAPPNAGNSSNRCSSQHLPCFSSNQLQQQAAIIFLLANSSSHFRLRPKIKQKSPCKLTFDELQQQGVDLTFYMFFPSSK